IYSTYTSHNSTHVMMYFFIDSQPSSIHARSLHDALPICLRRPGRGHVRRGGGTTHRQAAGALVLAPRSRRARDHLDAEPAPPDRSEEHTSELQSRENLVCRLLLEKKKSTTTTIRASKHAP